MPVPHSHACGYSCVFLWFGCSSSVIIDYASHAAKERPAGQKVFEGEREARRNAHFTTSVRHILRCTTIAYDHPTLKHVYDIPRLASLASAGVPARHSQRAASDHSSSKARAAHPWPRPGDRRLTSSLEFIEEYHLDPAVDRLWAFVEAKILRARLICGEALKL